MQSPYHQLVEDHRRLTKLLEYVYGEISHYDDDTVETDLNLVIQAVDYIKDYPETVHHPIEEAAFDYMVERNIGAWAAIPKLREQHASLERETDRLSRLLDQVRNDYPTPVPLLKQALTDCVVHQFIHMQNEETDIFPTIEHQLKSGDWELILSRVAIHSDPLFNKNPIEPYADLSRRLGLQ